MKLKFQFVRILIATIFLICTIEAFFWPIIMKPGTQLEFWQIHFLAQLGYVIGFPALVTHYYLNVLGMNVSDSGAILISFIWAVIIYVLLTIFAKKNRNPVQPIAAANSALRGE
jgi:hypothetical protein